MNYYIFYIIILTIGILALQIITSRIRGWIGEATVSTILSSLPSEEYRVINNVMLKNERGTTQIDHVVVSVYGIFVIETKNYKGWITGGEYSEQWTKNMFGKKYKFRNPIKQNYGHVKALEKLLSLPSEMFIPIVVFTSSAELKVKTSSSVVYTVKLKKLLRSYTELKISVEEVGNIANKIALGNIDSAVNRKEHVQSIRNKVKTDNLNVRVGICPKCGGKLLTRNGKYGKFTGCSNYPACRYTKK